MRKGIYILLTTFLFAGCTVTNTYNTYYGKVVDKETGQPIHGAVVLAVYNTEQYGLGGPVSHFADAQEVLTTKNGEFIIPAKRIVSFSVISGWERYPHFIIFKPGYGCYPNHHGVKPIFIPNGTLPANQELTIELPPVKTSSRQDRLKNAACLPSPIVPDGKYTVLERLIDIEYKSLGN